MTEFADFVPLFVRTETDLRTDFDARANAGLTADDPDWVDTRPLSLYWLATQPQIVEFASLYDRLNEAVAAGIVATSWEQYLDAHAAGFGEERLAATYATGTITITGDDGTLIGTGFQVSTEQTDPDVDPIAFETTDSGTIAGGTLDLPIKAVLAGSDGNVAADAIKMLQSSEPGITGVTNADATDGGAEVEDDPSLKIRLQQVFEGNGNNVASYVREVLKWPGVGRVRVIPAWNGPGTVKVVIEDASGNPLPAQVAPLQDYLDPVPGMGSGWAPINHVVTVSTPTVVSIYTTATPTFQPGYSLDGTSGSVALRQSLIDAVANYLDSLQPGDDVVFNHVLAAFFEVEGVLNVTNLKIGTAPAPAGVVDIAIDDDHVAQPATVVLS
jgi:uncharacterized phage protein gp47/JayE